MAAVENEDKLRDYLKQVTTTLRRTRSKLRDRDREPIAVVGMGCRFPGGVREPEDLWRLLAAGADTISAFPQDRGWDPDGLYAALDADAAATHLGAFIYDAADFDAAFFGISPREALAMDPQQRLLLETAWEAVERAGISPASLKGSATGVFAGAGFGGYGGDLVEEGGSEGYLMIGSLTSIISGRVSYTLGLEGPAVTVDTACSSALVALHLACQALRSRECGMALAGGVAVMSTPGAFAEFSKQQGLAFDGRCKAFAAGADGIGWGEGAGMLVLERLSDARRNGRNILAVIAGSAMNQDGASNGITAPNGPSQQKVIRSALASAGLRADQVDAVEAHGTGTALGDPIEAQALLATYGQDREDDRPLWLGSVKTNIGHTQTAAGVAGIIKMVLALQHEELPRTLYAEEPSPEIDWSSGEVKLLNEPVSWPANGRARRAGVSAFGISGTNVHVILEEAPAASDAPADVDPEDAPIDSAGEQDPTALPVLNGELPAWLVSARSAAGLAGQAARLGEYVQARPALQSAEVASSLIATRSVFEQRAVVIGRDRDELLSGLSAVAAGQPSANVVAGVVPASGLRGRTVFVFPGQGSQWVGMGRELAASSPVFAARLAECGKALAPYVAWSLDDVLAGRDGAPGFDRVDVVQPTLWAVMVSLAAVWQAAGVQPDAVLGHSQGEIAAAVVAGSLTLEDAAKVVALRSKALVALSGRGGMLSIAESVDAVQRRIEPWADRVSVAAVNGPGATVVSGTPEALEEIRDACDREDVRARILPVDYASHGPQVDELRDEILKLLDGLAPQQGRIPMVSAMTGEVLTGPELDAGYWYASLRATVQFALAVEVLDRTGYGTFIETSAHPVLTSSISATLEELANSDEGVDLARPAPIVTGTLRRDGGGPLRLLASLAEVHVRGVAVGWQGSVIPAAPWVELPTYAFQRQRFWPKPLTASAIALGSGAGSAAEARFWSAIEAGDVYSLSRVLAVDDAALGELVPALASWRARERDESATASWRYRISWTPMRDATAPPTLSGTWLAVIPAGLADSELITASTQALIERGAHVVPVEVAANELDRSSLVTQIREALDAATSDIPAGVLSLLGLDESPLADRAAVPAGVAGTLGLLQAIGDLGWATPLWAITQSAVTTGDGDVLANPTQAQVWGLGRTAGVEHPNRWGGLIDLPTELDERTAARLVGVLADGSEDQVAIRSGGVLARRLVHADPRRAIGGVWTPRGTVLLTGASGAIGPDLAAWMADAGVEHAVLSSRRGPQTPGAAVLAAYLAEAGSSVTMASCDVADREALGNLLQWIPTFAPPLSTVIHAAVSVELMNLDLADADQLAMALGAKVGGAQNLDELTADLDLDAFILFSSITATWGVGEHGTYAAANAHLDALAQNRRARGLPATSVAWGVWSSGGRFDDSADGAPDRPQSLIPERLKRQGLRLLDPERALSVLGQVLADDETVLSVADVDWSRFSAVFNAVRSWPLLDEIPEARQVGANESGPAGTAIVTSGEAAALLARLVEAAPGQRQRIVADLVGNHAAAVLGFTSADEVETDRAFRDMGFDSLTAVDLRGRLNQATGLQLPSTVVFDYPSPATLAQEIVKRLVGANQQSQGTVSRVTPVSASDPIVIVGLGCRFPGGVDSPEAMWQVLANGDDVVGGFPTDRGWDIAGLLDGVPGSALASVTSEGGFVAGAADFDPSFFRISPREALAMDPQQRLLLETSWEALERAGLDPVSLRGSLTGVFAGAAASGYAAQTGFGADLDGAEGHLLTGNVTSVISGRISYTLGLEGPAVTVDTACSSALVSLHLAAQALRAGECDLALAGGVMVIADPAEFIGFSQQGALALDGRCKAFAADADGMGLSEGAGMIVLERLSDARRNGHPVLAMVAGSAVNQDGASNGLTAPNGPSQQRVIRAALASAGLGTSDVDAVEAHGTGTKLGDPIEAQALLATYGQDRPEGRPLWLGTVKSNIGHAQQAAGAAGIIKMVLALQHGLLPATLHAEVPSPHVDWSEGDVQLLNEAVDWKQNGHPRRAGVSAFGISGTNAHIILEEAPVEEALIDDAPDLDPLLPSATAWLVSGQTASGLVDQARYLADHLAAHPELDPADVSWSLATTRSLFEHRAVVTGADRDELTAGLRALAANSPAPGVVTGEVGGTGQVVFVFPGQGSQWVGMGRELAASSPVFAARLAECGRALSAYVDWSLEEVLASGDFDRVDVVQPVLWAMMVSLAEFWQAAGVTPDAVLGHSQGEIAAAVVAGILSLDDAAKVVALRSKALTALSGRGGMLSIAESAEAVRNRITDDRVAVAAVNGPSATVVSGDPEALQQLLAACESEDVRARMLPVDYASHGPQVEELREEILGVLSGLTPRAGVIPMVSALTGEYLQGPEMDAEYWYASLRGTVEFSRATEILGRAGYRVFIETSAHPVLTSAISDTLDEFAPVVTGTLRRDEGGPVRALASLATAHVHGVFVDWTAVLPVAKRVELPTYAFQRQRYWPKQRPQAAATTAAGTIPAAESAFWTAVETGDLTQLSQTLAVDVQGLSEILPALAAWRRRERGESTVADWRYRISWAPVVVPGSANLSGTWLVISHPGDAEQCIQALTAHGADVRHVEIPADEIDRQALAAHITEALGDEDAPAVAGIISLLALDNERLAASPVVPRALAATTGLVQALGDLGLGAPVWVLTSGAVAAAAGEVPTSPLAAQTWAFGRVVGLEYPNRWGGLIDLPAAWDTRTAGRLATVLAGCGEDQVAIRVGGVLGRRLMRAGRPRVAENGQWRPSGSVLVTGGTGGVGGHVARWLTERGAERIVLSSRSGPGARGVPSLAAQLAAAGSAVSVVAGDIGDRAQADNLVHWIGNTGPQLSSVMHAAGAGLGGPIDGITVTELTDVAQAKVGGAEYLDAITAELGLDLDAFVVFSSGAAAWGSAQLAGYAAANAALDALVEDRRARGLSGTSIAWGLWGGGGMGEGPAGTVLQRLGVREMDPEPAIAALAGILDADEPLIAVSDTDWERFAPVFTVQRASPLLADLPDARRALDDSTAAGPDGPGSTAGTERGARLHGLSRPEQERLLGDLVRAEAAAVLGHASAEAVPATRAFRDLGFDSLTAVDLRTRLNAATGLKLPATLVFDHPTPTAVVDYLLTELLGALTDTALPGAALAAIDPGDPIAIIGLGCRYPGGAVTPDAYWDLLSSGTDAISAFPADRGWDADRVYGVAPGGGSSAGTREGGFVYDATGFDAGFFGISPREALAMDPQQRLLLETTWEALERAGIDPDSLRGSQTGVFAGATYSAYGVALADSPGAEGYMLTGNAGAVISGRISYTLGLEGPAVTVDTACSSSLVALHLASQALRGGECSLALASGVTVMATPGAFAEFARQQGLAGDGRCKSFGAGADGTGWGEGAGVLVLERLSDARRNGHQILAVVRGSAVNQDGASNGLTAPNGPSQQRVIRAALNGAGLTTADVDVVEAHGTGTVLGDPIEAQAVLATYGRDRPEDRPLWLGSVKSNIGHTQAAAGVAGVIKMVLAMQHETLPVTLFAEEPSPHVDWSAGDVRLLTEPVEWKQNGRPRRAGVSAFGVSGTNAHVIVEEAPPVEADADETTSPGITPILEPAPSAWLVSGRSAAGLSAQAARLAAHLNARTDIDPADLAWSLATTRSAFEHRAVIIDGLDSGLAALATGTSAAGVIQATVPPNGVGRVGFLFAGQGTQRAGMARGLYSASPVFAEAFDHACALLEAELGLPIRDVVLGTDSDDDDSRATQTLYAQTGLFAIEVGLLALLTAAGIVPDAVAGHSVGEIAAAHAAGVLSLADAARLVANRARLMQALPEGGAMAAIAATEDEVLASLDGATDVSIAAINGPTSVVISGEANAVDALVETWRERERRVRRLRVSHAFHSARMDPVLDELGSIAAAIEHAQPLIAWVGALTGETITRPEPVYWAAQARHAVRFGDAVAAMAGQGVSVFIEIGPDGTLSAMGANALPTPAQFIPVLRPDTEASTAVVAALARAHVHGVAVDWSALLTRPADELVELPTYAFQHQHFWPQPAPGAGRQHTGGGAGTEAEALFWAAIERGDVAGLTGALDVDGSRPFSEVLPALASWHRRDREDSLTAGWRYRVGWTPLADDPTAPAKLSGAWLLVAGAKPDTERVRALADVMTAAGARVLLAEAAADEVDRGSLAARLSRTLTSADSEAAAFPVVAGVLSLLAADESPLADAPAVTTGLAATLGLLQALADLGISSPVWAATSGAVATGPADTLSNPIQAQVWGLGRIAGLELPGVWGGLIDLPPTLDQRAAARLVAVLAGSVERGEDQLAIRGGAILGRRLLPAPQPRGNSVGWTTSGSALITGGTGAIGGRLADWLSEREVPRVVLVSRSGPRSAAIAERAARLANAGTVVEVVACDTADRGKLGALLDWIDRDERAPLRAVFHAAGIAQGAAILDTTVADLTAEALAKTAGATHLDELTTDRTLDAFVVFSSGAAIWGSGLQTSYAAANAYLDGLAENRRFRGLPATSVSWGLWGGGGMGEGEGGAQLERLGLQAMDPVLAIGALATVLDHDESLVTVADLDWAKFAPVFTLHRPSALISEVPEVKLALAEPAAEIDGRGTVAATELGRQLQGLDRAEQDRILTDLIRNEAALVLGHPSPDAVEAGRAFKDVGFDSLTAVELRDRLNAATGLKLPATLVFDYPTPVALAEQLRADLMIDERSGASITVHAAAASDEPIAIVGMSCRLPGGAGTLEDFWSLLSSGTDAVAGFPTDRGWEAFGPADGNWDAFAPVGGFVYDAGEFDPAFFGISPREALAMDPQQRLLLETSWEALEQAGIDPASLRGTPAGVFAGAWSSGYGMSLQPSAESAGTEGYFLTGSATSVISGRVSYTLGLEGPAVTVDTACSSSLVALHLACQSLRSGESTLALAGGVTVMATPGAFAEFALQQGLAGDGRCKSFGADADGTGWGEGAGVLVVERLADARRNGHRVLAVVRGSAVNQDGTSNGLTAPNGPSQQRVIRTALADARLTPADIDAVEAHGTGTVLGDPIEAQALLATYGRERRDGEPLWLGSVKSNIGHTQAAAGVAGIIKMVLAMRHEVLPATLHADQPSPHVDWTAGAVWLLSEAMPWPANGHPRRAGVSSFGVSGTNAHIILEEPLTLDEPQGSDEADGFGQDPEPASPALPVLTNAPSAWLVSAKTVASLAGQAERLAAYAEADSALDRNDLAWSLAVTRSAFEHRAIAIGTAPDELIAGLRAVAADEPAANVVTGTVVSGDKRTVFVFPGQGSQWVGMGRELGAASPVFAARLAECAQALAPYVDWSLDEVLAGAEGAPSLERVDVVQPALWAVMVSLAAFWSAAGVKPDAVVGHSQGEIAAAVVAGVLSLDDGAKVVALRSKALTALAGHGGMVSIAESADAVEARLAAWDGRLTVATVNGPDATVVSGDPEAVEQLAAACEQDGVRARILPVDYASHGPQVDDLREEILSLLAGISPQPTRLPMVSAMTGEQVQGPELGADYWFASLRASVRFSAAIETLGRAGYRVFVEASPHPVLIAPITATLDQAEDAGSGRTPVVVGTLRREDGGAERALRSLAEVHVHGIGVDWSAVLPAAARVDLPTYAFERRRYWSPLSLAGTGDVRSAGLGAVGHPLLGAAVELAGGQGVVVLTGRISLRAAPWLGDHAVGGTVLLPGTAFVEFAVRAGYEVGCARIVELTLAAPLVLGPTAAVQVQVVVGAPDQDGQRSVEIYSRPDDAETAGWIQHAGGLLAPDQPSELERPADFLVWPPTDAESVDVSNLYEIQAAGGYGYGPVFQGLRAAWRRGAEVFAEIALPESSASDAARFGIHPALLDSSLHAAGLIEQPEDAADPDSGGGVRLPFSWSGVSLQAAGASILRVRLSKDEAGSLVLDAADPTGAPVVSVQSLALRPIAAGALRAAADPLRDSLFAVDWIPAGGGALASPVDRWALIGADLFGIATDAAPTYADLAALADAIEAGESAPELVLVEVGADPATDLSVAETSRHLASETLGLIQNWFRLAALSDARLVIVTKGAIAARPGEPVTDLAAASVWGLVRSAQSEEPDRLVLVDLPAEDSTSALDDLAAAIASGEPELAIREKLAYARRLTRTVSQPEPEVEDAHRRVGTVLITGGTGMLGALVSRHLAATGRAERLLLLSRSGPSAAGAAALAADCALAGVAVRIAAADAADRPALAAVLAGNVEGLTSVVHTAGVLDDGVIGSLTPERIDAVMRPKTDAAWNLHELTADAELDSFVLFSAGAATFGAAGQGNYAAGNAFLDSLAAHRHAAGLPAVSLAWGLWAEASAMTGHLSDADRKRAGSGGMTALSAEDGLALLNAALGRPEALLVPVKLNVATLRARAARGERLAAVWRALAGDAPRPAAAADSANAGRQLRSQLNAVAEADRDRILLSLVRTHAAAVLGHSTAEAVGGGRAFKDLGFDSLTALELRNRLNVATGLKLPATLAFDYPTPAVLAEYLKREVGSDKADTGRAALDEVAKLQRLVAGIDSGDDARTALAARVRTLLQSLEGEHEATVGEGADNDLKAATVENIFDLLDNELAD